MFMALIQKRRSIRKFLDKPVEAEKIDLLVEAALRAPSSRGLTPWEFIVVTGQDLLEKLAGAKQQGSAFLKKAPLGIVVCADPEQCDIWVEDASIAAIFIQLAAESLGLGSCWIQIRERMHNGARSAEEYISGILHIPAKMKVESIIAIGYPDEQKPPHGKEELLYEKVHNDIYGRPYYTAIV
jgi:nitroreductase